MEYFLIAALLSPAKLILCFEAVFRVFAMVRMALDNLLKGEICKQMTGSQQAYQPFGCLVSDKYWQVPRRLLDLQ